MRDLIIRPGLAIFSLMVLAFMIACTSGGDSQNQSTAPAAIQRIFDKPLYKNAIWGLRVVDLDKNVALINQLPERQFFVGSVRKVFSVGEWLNQVGPATAYNTPVFRNGAVDSNGVLHGDLILVASGDLTMGGRTNPDGSIAVSNYDHNEADSLGNAVLTSPNPLAGYASLAHQVAQAGVKEIAGQVIIDDRLFRPFNFRGQFDVRPIFVNDDAVDMSINPGTVGGLASVVSRPVSAALRVNSTLSTRGPGAKTLLEFNAFPAHIGTPGCTASIGGELATDYLPPLTNRFPLVQTFRIVQPSNYARTVFIEQLQAAGVKVDAPVVAENPTPLLPPRGSYPASSKVAQLAGMTVANDAKLILKVSYNIGADTSLVLYGLTQGVDNINAALSKEKVNLSTNYGIPDSQYAFVDGSGGGNTTATSVAVTQMLTQLRSRPTFTSFLDALPILGVDGSLSFVTDFESDSSLAGAKGQVHAKTGTFVEGSAKVLVLKGQDFAGYINAKSGRHLVYQLVVNNVPINEVTDVIKVFQDEGTISAILWRDF